MPLFGGLNPDPCTDHFKFEIEPPKYSSVKKQTILTCQYFDGRTHMSFGHAENGSLWIDSYFFNGTYILRSNILELTEVGFSLFSNHISDEYFFEISEESFDFFQYESC